MVGQIMKNSRISYKVGNILKNVKRGLILHQVNCLGVMGGGIALGIRQMYPAAYMQYLAKYLDEGWTLGESQFVPVSLNKDETKVDLYIGNLAGQKEIGSKDGKCPTDYHALTICLDDALDFANRHQLEVHTVKIGCGLGGGDWSKVEEILEELCEDYGINVTVWDFK